MASLAQTSHDILSKNKACAKTAHKVTHVKSHITESRKAGLVPSFTCEQRRTKDWKHKQQSQEGLGGLRGKPTGGGNIT